MRTKTTTIVFLWILFGPFASLAQNPFTEVAQEAGIEHAFRIDMATFGGGAAVIDIDNDGFEDVYITGGVAEDVLYKNNGDGTFTNIIHEAGFDITTQVNTQGVTAADVNRDGFKDLLITTMTYTGQVQEMAPNILYLNNRDGTFMDATSAYGLDQHRVFSTAATFGDINADGYPDLYISNYFFLPRGGDVSFNVLNEAIINNSFVPAPDYLFINAGGKSFIDASEMYGLEHYGYGFQGVFTDYDNDGDLDLHIANDFGTRKTPNIMLRNDYPKKSYKDRSLNLALNYGMNAMGIACGDYNMDGWMDYFVTNIGTSLLCENQKDGSPFIDRTFLRGLALPLIEDEAYTGVPVSWGANFFDYDHDMDLDLFVSNGALNPTIRFNPNLFFENRYGRYYEKAKDYGLFDYRIGRGSVTFDYDNDGDLDLLVVNQEPRDNIGDLPPARTLLYRNDTESGNWLQVELEGVQAEKNGIGSRVELFVGGKVLIREIDGGSSHLSQNSTIAHFGLGPYTEVDSLVIKWVGGKKQVLKNVSINQRTKVIESEDWFSSFEQNNLEIYPSSFDSQIVVEYQLAEKEEAFRIAVWDTQGREIELLDNTQNPSHNGVLQWNVPAGLSDGVYIFRLITNRSTVVKKGIKI